MDNFNLADDILTGDIDDINSNDEDELIISDSYSFDAKITDPIDELYIERNPIKRFINNRKKKRNKNRLRMIKLSKFKNRK